MIKLPCVSFTSQDKKESSTRHFNINFLGLVLETLKSLPMAHFTTCPKLGIIIRDNLK